jgi:hypothetical protein
MRLIAMMVAAAVMIWPLAGVAADPVPVGKFSAWAAYTFDDAGGKICYIVSEPTKKDPPNARRDDIYLLATHRPDAKVFDEVSTIVGYPFESGYKPSATVSSSGGKSDFEFFSEGDAAWADSGNEKALIAAMRAGNTIVVKGKSSLGTNTTDTYSLSGVSAALDKINAECGRK